jgi:hypothetical protein
MTLFGDELHERIDGLVGGEERGVYHAWDGAWEGKGGFLCLLGYGVFFRLVDWGNGLGFMLCVCFVVW